MSILFQQVAEPHTNHFRRKPGRFVKQDLPTRFWSHVDKSTGQGPNGDCWQWTGWRFTDKHDRKTYGGFTLNRKTRKAHHVAFELQNGSIPPGKSILHHCDNPPCVRGTHLFAGTSLDNVADRNAKGRQARGIKVSATRRCFAGQNGPNSKLTCEMVANIRAEYARGDTSYPKLAMKYGLHKSSVYNVVRRRTWAVDSQCTPNRPDVPALAKNSGHQRDSGKERHQS